MQSNTFLFICGFKTCHAVILLGRAFPNYMVVVVVRHCKCNVSANPGVENLTLSGQETMLGIASQHIHLSWASLDAIAYFETIFERLEHNYLRKYGIAKGKSKLKLALAKYNFYLRFIEFIL